MLAQLPPLGFPGSLTIFLLSPISSERNSSNRGEREREKERRDGEIEVRAEDGAGGDRAYAGSVSVGVEGQKETEWPLPFGVFLSAKLI